MPGLLMEQQPSGIATNATLKHEVVTSPSPYAAPAQPIQTNGIHDVASAKPQVVSKVRDDLPQLDDSWRQSSANLSFGKMLDRMAEGCLADFHDLTAKFNNEATAPAQTNGVRPADAEDTDQASLSMKRHFMEFASQWRERFIKARIISDWARTSGEEVARLIDIRSTILKRIESTKACVEAVMSVKVDSINVQMPEYNLAGAMQYLSTGSSNYPDLGYISPGPLTATEILDMMHEMEIASQVRLMLHEPKIPYWMSRYRIGDGRVTFSSDGEFEVDLALTDEDPKVSPWYFVDFRFSFTPAPIITDADRPVLESQVNAATNANSLTGCYDFCHNFTLEFKLSEYETQAYSLLRGRWFETLRVERVRRIITIQYWIGRAGKKSWVELNVHSGKGLVHKHEPITPRIVAIWHREGEVIPGYLDLDYGKIDAQKMLLDVTRQHADMILEKLNTSLASKQPSPVVFTHSLEQEDADSECKYLVIRLPSHHVACTNEIRVSIQPRTGTWQITPSDLKVTPLQQAVLQIPDELTADALVKLACSVMQDGVEFAAQQRGWSKISTILPNSQRDFKDCFKSAAEVSLWRPHNSFDTWSKDWSIGYSTGLQETQWWTVRCRVDGRSYVALEAHELSVTLSDWTQRLAQAERVGMEQIKSVKLKAQSAISYTTEHFVPTGQLTDTEAVCLFVDPDELTGKRLSSYWSGSVARISDGRLHNRRNQYIRLTVRPGQLAHLRQHLPVKDIQVNENNGLAVSFDASFTRTIFATARLALEQVVKLDRMIKTTSRLSCKYKTISLHEFAFTYGQHDLSALLTFTTNTQELKLYPSKTNPHQRIQRFLEQLLNKGGPSSFDNFAYVLHFTLPLLTSIKKLDPGTWTVHTRQATWFVVQFSASFTQSFTIRAGRNSRRVRWHLSQDTSPAESKRESTMSASTATALQDLWSNPGLGCEGVKAGVIADASGIARVLDKLALICAGR